MVGAHPSQSRYRMRFQEEMLKAGVSGVGLDSRQCVVEPVVKTAHHWVIELTGAVGLIYFRFSPIFPERSRPALDEITKAWIRVLVHNGKRRISMAIMS